MRAAFLAIMAIALTGCWSTSSETRLDDAARTEFAMIEIESGHPAAAIDILEQALERNPDYAPHYLTLAAAWSHYQHGDLVAANLRKFLDLEPGHHQARLYLAEVLHDQEKVDEAKIHFETFLACATARDVRTRRHRRHAASRLADVASKSGDEFAASYFAALRDYEAAIVLLDPAIGDQAVPEHVKKDASQKLAAAMSELQEAQQLGEHRDAVESSMNLVAQALKDLDAGRPIASDSFPWVTDCPCHGKDAHDGNPLQRPETILDDTRRL